MPETLSGQRRQLIRTTIAATENFNRAVTRYNDAIGQFPALLLAWLFGFHAARGLRSSARVA